MTEYELSGYRLTPKAEADLEDIWLYTAQSWSPVQADRYIDGLLAILDTLVAMPTIARVRSEFDPPIRIHPFAEHMIIYRTENNWLSVIRILGGRQNWRGLLETIDA